MAIGLGLATVGLAGMPDSVLGRQWLVAARGWRGVPYPCAVKTARVSRHWYVAFYASIVLFAQMAMAILALVMIAIVF